VTGKGEGGFIDVSDSMSRNKGIQGARERKEVLRGGGTGSLFLRIKRRLVHENPSHRAQGGLLIRSSAGKKVAVPLQRRDRGGRGGYAANNVRKTGLNYHK